MAFLKVEENFDYEKDPETNRVINANSADYYARKRKISSEQKKKQQIQELKDELLEMKNLIKELQGK